MTDQRHRSLDVLRGLMLVIMTIDHLDLFGPIYRFTYETVGFASAAEGFVLLSGVVAGLVYGRHADEGRLTAKITRRLGTLWQHHLVVTGALLVWWWWQAAERPASSMLTAVISALGGAVLLNQEPPLDILALYLVLVAALVPALRLLLAGRTTVLLTTVGAMWGVDQILSAQSWYPHTILGEVAGVSVIWHPNHFHLLAWLLLFVLGAWAGWRHRRGDGRLVRRAALPVTCLAVVVLVAMACLRHGVILPQYPVDRLEVGRSNLGAVRLLNVALIAWVLTQLATRWPGMLRHRWLELLGRNALIVFVWHVMLQLFLRPHYLEAAARWGLGARLVILILAVASLTAPAWWRERRRRLAGTA